VTTGDCTTGSLQCTLVPPELASAPVQVVTLGGGGQTADLLATVTDVRPAATRPRILLKDDHNYC